MACPYLGYRQSTDAEDFQEARAYCEVAERFVQPMRADVCNDRYSLEHDSHCEIFLTATPEDDSTSLTSEETDS